MFGYMYNKILGNGYLILVNATFSKSDLDSLIGKTQAEVLSDPRSLAYADVSGFSISETPRVTPRYGVMARPNLTTVNSMHRVRSGQIQGGLFIIGNPITNTAFMNYALVSAEIYGTQKYAANGSPDPNIVYNIGGTYYVD